MKRFLSPRARSSDSHAKSVVCERVQSVSVVVPDLSPSEGDVAKSQSGTSSCREPRKQQPLRSVT